MRLPELPHPNLLLLLPLLTISAPTHAQQSGSVTLNLATTADETSTTLTVPFNTLFNSIRQKGVSIQVSNGDNVPIPDSDILCQCFSDTAGTQPLGGTFDNVFPGVEFSTEPVKIGAILCSDKEGLAGKVGGGTGGGAGSQNANANGNVNGNQAQQPPAETTTSAPAVITTQPPPPPTTTTTTTSPPPPPPSTTAATSPLATSTPPSSPPAPAPAPNSNSNSNSNSNTNTPTASLRFSLSTDPSDDSSTQISVPIDSSIVLTTGLAKTQAKAVTLISISPPSFGSSGSLVCQAFSDTGAKVPMGGGFGVDVERVLGGEGGVGSVGCAMVEGGGFGGEVGLVGT